MTEVRKLGPGDAALWRSLRLEALETYPLAFLTTYDEAAAIPLEDIRFGLERGHTYAVFLEGQPVGMGTLVPQRRVQTRHRAEIGGLFIQPAAQGQGAADALLDALIAEGHAIGAWQLELYVAASNTRAIRFYARHGFMECGRVPNATLADGVAETDLMMIRSAPPGA